MKKVKLNILLFLYNGILIFLAIGYILFLLVTWQKSKLHKFFKTNFGFRKKLTNGDNSSPYIWIHTSSVGESMLMFPLVEEIISTYPRYKILVTSCTNTSKEVWEKTFKNTITHHYLPWDIKFLVKKFIKSFNIKLTIFVEAEFWPNYLFELKRNKVPVLLFNARMSDNSYKKWLNFRFIISEMLAVFSFIGAESKKSYNYIKEFIGNHTIELWGNLKYLDNNVIQPDASYINEFKMSLKNKWVVLALSTHAPEEQMLAEIYIKLKKNVPNLLFIISPRHIERSPQIQLSLTELKIKTQFFSESPQIYPNTDIFIMNVFGHTDSLCTLSHIVYMGKSMFKNAKGGHNILQPMKKGVLVIFGQYMDNFKELSELALNGKAAIEVKSPKELYLTLTELFKDPAKLKRMGNRAKELTTQSTDIKEKYLRVINNYLT